MTHDAQGRKLGAGGWPIFKGASKAFPGEDALGCPRCSSTDITLTCSYGPGGRLGDPGGREVNICNSCGLRHSYEGSSR